MAADDVPESRSEGKFRKAALCRLRDQTAFLNVPWMNGQEEARRLLEEARALQTGHFVLRSGLHSSTYIQCARLGEDLVRVSRLTELLLESYQGPDFETVLAPAMGALVLGQEVARQSRKRFLFAEKEEDRLVLRRGFVLRPGEKVLVVEDVITRGGRVQECLDLIRAAGGEPVGIVVIADRSEGQASFDVPLTALLRLSIPTYPADALPPELAAIPVTKPGS